MKVYEWSLSTWKDAQTLVIREMQIKVKIRARDFPGGPVGKTLLPVKRFQVQSLIGELRSHRLCVAQPEINQTL